jgi:hypothetical protein
MDTPRNNTNFNSFRRSFTEPRGPGVDSFRSVSQIDVCSFEHFYNVSKTLQMMVYQLRNAFERRNVCALLDLVHIPEISISNARQLRNIYSSAIEVA